MTDVHFLEFDMSCETTRARPSRFEHIVRMSKTVEF